MNGNGGRLGGVGGALILLVPDAEQPLLGVSPPASEACASFPMAVLASESSARKEFDIGTGFGDGGFGGGGGILGTAPNEGVSSLGEIPLCVLLPPTTLKGSSGGSYSSYGLLVSSFGGKGASGREETSTGIAAHGLMLSG